MSILKQIDWQILSFVGLSLVNEYLINMKSTSFEKNEKGS